VPRAKEDSTLSPLGLLIRRARRKAGLTQAAAAALLAPVRINQSRLSAIEAGTGIPDRVQEQAIVEAFGMSARQRRELSMLVLQAEAERRAKAAASEAA
jgi:transcriptional regulator with XRE-family HTH domain